jgi:hypothetical protein
VKFLGRPARARARAARELEKVLRAEIWLINVGLNAISSIPSLSLRASKIGIAR